MSINLNTTAVTGLNTTSGCVPTVTGITGLPYTYTTDTVTVNDLDDLQRWYGKGINISSGTISVKTPQQETKMKKTTYHDYVVYIYDLTTEDGKKANRKVAEIKGEIELDAAHNLDKHVLLKHSAEISKIPNVENFHVVVKSLNSFPLEYVSEGKK